MKPKSAWEKMKSQNAARRQAIVRLRTQGLTLQQIADRWQMSRQRVHQILKRGR
jgi:DNA-directed RNA polymerase specialized sigma24 family protein